jgi:Tfp pilus assembly protein PilX
MKTLKVVADERGIAMVVALFMVLLLSLLGSSMMFVATTETISSLNYKTMSQARYAAESGVHSAANHLLHTYVPPSAATADALAFYNMTQSPVTFNAADVVLSSAAGVNSNYPVDAVRDAFIAASQGTLTTGVGTVNYSASARLISMRVITDTFTGVPVTLQTWEITGRGNVAGLGTAAVEVSAIIERQETPVFKYAAFATDDGCDALTFGGGATTNSYDSRDYAGSGTPTFENWGGNVGTNGGLTGLGVTTTIHGTLSTPRSGVGNCTNGNITAADLNGGATVDGGLIQLPQEVSYPDPPAISPLPPTTNYAFNTSGACPGGLTVAQCAGNAVAGTTTLTPETAASCGCSTPAALVLGDVSVTGGGKLHLRAGTYIVNSLSFAGNSELVLDSGPVVIKVAGQNTNTPIDFTGGSIANDTYDPALLQFFYGGNDNIKLTGGAASAALFYAPNASARFSGGGGFFGAVVAREITDMGGATIHYDRSLDTTAVTAGNPVMSSFTWRSF